MTKCFNGHEVSPEAERFDSGANNTFVKCPQCPKGWGLEDKEDKRFLLLGGQPLPPSQNRVTQLETALREACKHIEFISGELRSFKKTHCDRGQVSPEYWLRKANEIK